MGEDEVYYWGSRPEMRRQGSKDAISPMPPFVRQRALRIIIEASEAYARERGSGVVQEEDLVSGTISQHFGEAPYFALVTVRMADGAVEHQEVIANPHANVPNSSF